MLFKDNLHTITNSLTSTHLGLALENFYRLKEQNSKDVGAISVILHSYFGFESAINGIGYEIFDNVNSNHYIARENRPVHLARFINNWKLGLQCTDKIEFIATHNGKTFAAALKSKLSELNILRNNLAHGISYSTTFLVEETDADNQYKVIDYEDSNGKEWKKKFPNCKFSPIGNINISDAEKALRIVLETLIELTKINNQYVFSALCHYNGPHFNLIYQESIIDKFFEVPKRSPQPDTSLE